MELMQLVWLPVMIMKVSTSPFNTNISTTSTASHTIRGSISDDSSLSSLIKVV